jgi:aspartyl aminopeptidase
MSEKLTAKQAAEQLLYKPEYAADKSADVKEKAAAFAEGYKAFLNAAKTEREAAAASEKLLLEAGYEKFEPKKTYAPGQKIYFVQEHKAVVAATIGRKSFEEGFRLVIAHIDSPRLDLRPNPLYEADHLSYFKTHYYGGIRKYQWGTMPLAIHGVFTRADGSSVSFAVGEDENDPVFCITDLLPHLGAEQNDRKLSEGIKAEELNVLIGSDAVEDADIKEAVKLNTLMLLHEKYGITERDFTRAEIEVVPAHKARDVGFDRSMVGGYGHDDRVDAYPALMAEIETKDPVHTTVCVLTDKEEIGSDGVTGMQSMYVFHFMQLLCRAAGQDDILAFQNSVCLSADVTAAYDPSWANAFEPQNGTYAGRGVAFFKYTGSRGKSSASDASAELVGGITRLLDANGVAWQIGELGRLDLGGGGTIAKYVANRGIPVLDIGVPVLSMHSPFEVIHKTDLYMAYRTFSLFCQNAD